MSRIRGIDELAKQLHAQDVERAANLRKSSGLAKRKPGTGPRIAR